MPPGGGGEGGGTGEQIFGEQDDPPAIGHECRDEEAASRSPPPPLPPCLAVTPVASQNKKMRREDEQQGEEQPAVSFPETSSSRSCLGCPTSRSSTSSACPNNGSPSAPTAPSARTLSGFFYFNLGWRFHNLSGKSPPIGDSNLRFLRDSYKYFTIQQCSTSLLLCKCWKSRHPRQYTWNFLQNRGQGQCFNCPEAKEFDYVVCNPATHEWTVLPPIELPDHLVFCNPASYEWTVLPPIELPGHLSDYRLGKYFLGFDLDIPSRFVVFLPLSRYYGTSVAMIYSSETGGWTSMQTQGTHPVGDCETTFLNGIMHFPTRSSSIIAVDMKRNAWRKIKMPPGIRCMYDDASIGHSQGRLYAWQIVDHYDCKLSIWVLENYDSGQWTLKCTVIFFLTVWKELSQKQ